MFAFLQQNLGVNASNIEIVVDNARTHATPSCCSSVSGSLSLSTSSHHRRRQGGRQQVSRWNSNGGDGNKSPSTLLLQQSPTSAMSFHHQMGQPQRSSPLYSRSNSFPKRLASESDSDTGTDEDSSSSSSSASQESDEDDTHNESPSPCRWMTSSPGTIVDRSPNQMRPTRRQFSDRRRRKTSGSRRGIQNNDLPIRRASSLNSVNAEHTTRRRSGSRRKGIHNNLLPRRANSIDSANVSGGRRGGVMVLASTKQNTITTTTTTTTRSNSSSSAATRRLIRSIPTFSAAIDSLPAVPASLDDSSGNLTVCQNKNKNIDTDPDTGGRKRIGETKKK